MFKNAFLSIKKNIGRSVLLFVLMCMITNLVIAGVSIRSATSQSMEQVRTSLGSEVTLSYNMKNMLKDREKGESMDETISSITLSMADQLKSLDYVENYNYTVSVGVTSDDIEPVSMSSSNLSTEDDKMPKTNESNQPRIMDENDFTVIGNTTMDHLSDFTNKNYILKSGRLLSEDDLKTNNCVIETNLATDNSLEIGDTIRVSGSKSDSSDVDVELSVVGIYEIETTNQMGGMMSNRQNPINQIYTDISTAQTLTKSTSEITSATYYLDDPKHIDTFKEQADEVTDIDFDTYTLDANDQVYQRSISSLESMESFASIFLWVVIGAGCAILCLVLILTIRGRFYEFGVLLSLGQAKIKIMLQQLLEVIIIAAIAFSISLGTGAMVSHVVSSMLRSSQSNDQMVMEKPNDSIQEKADSPALNNGLLASVDTELDVSLTSSTIIQLATITGLICIVSVVLPAVYILRLSPREILVKKE